MTRPPGAIMFDKIVGWLLVVALGALPVLAGSAVLAIVRMIRRGRGRRSEDRARLQLQLFGLASVATGIAFSGLVLFFRDEIIKTVGEIFDDLLLYSVGKFINGVLLAVALVSFSLIVFAGITSIRTGSRLSRRAGPGEPAWARVERGLGRMRAIGWMLVLLPIFNTSMAGGLLIAVFAAAVLGVLRAQRRGREATLLALLADVTQAGLPLAGEIESFGNMHGDRYGRKLRNVAAQLEAGTPLSQALAQNPGLVPYSSVLAICLGEETGTLATRLREEAARRTPEATAADRYPVSPAVFVLYALGVPSILLLLVLYHTCCIMPQFTGIWHGFHAEPLPPATAALQSVSGGLNEFSYIIVPAGVVLSLLVGMAVFAWYRGWGEFEIPLAGRWFRRFDAPELLRSLAAAIEARQPVDGTLMLFSIQHRRAAVRRGTEWALKRHEAGGDVWDALYRQGLLRRGEPALIHSAERAGHVPWVLRQLAATIENRRDHRLAMLAEIGFPILVVGIGAVAGLVAMAIFMPPIEYTTHLSTRLMGG